MNATATQVKNILDELTGFATVAGLVEETGKSETTIRKALKELETEGFAHKNAPGQWENTKPVETDESPKRRYVRHDKPTTRTVRLNQITHSEVRVALTAEEPQVTKNFGVSNKWVTICVTHNAATGSDKVLDAHYASTYPTFCPTCAPKLEGKVGRRRQLAVAS